MPPARKPDDLDDLERAALAAIEAMMRMTLIGSDERGLMNIAAMNVREVANHLRRQEARDA